MPLPLESSGNSQIASLPNGSGGGMTIVEPGRGRPSGLTIGVSVDLLHHLDSVVQSRKRLCGAQQILYTCYSVGLSGVHYVVEPAPPSVAQLSSGFRSLDRSSRRRATLCTCSHSQMAR